MNNEIWKYIKNSEYQISSIGRFKNPKNRISKSNGGKKRYNRISYKDNDGNKINTSIHKLVAETFLKISKILKQKIYKCKKLEVDHINGNKKDNRLVNLEWVTHSINVNRAIKNKSPKNIKQKNINKNYNNEIWKKFKKNNDYLVSNFGRIKRISTDNILLGCGERYKRVKIYINNDIKSYAIHRMVSETWIDNPLNKPYVNHIDRITFNNNYNNLEWCTQKENMSHASKNNLLIKSENRKRDCYKLELDGNIIEKIIGINNSNISNVCSNYSKNKKDRCIYEGYGYCYIEDYKKPIINKSLLNIFPDIDCKKIKNREEWNKLRIYVSKKSKPIWKKKIDGTKIEITTITNEIKNGIKNINNSIENNTYSSGFGWEYANYLDVINYPKILEYKKIKNKVLDIFNLDYNLDIDYDLIERNLFKMGGGKVLPIPIWQISEDGHRIQKFDNIEDCRKKLNLKRNIINGFLIGKYNNININNKNYSFEEATYYIENNNYRIIKYSDKVWYNKNSKTNNSREIIQYNLDKKIIKIWKSKKDIYNNLKIKVNSSYKIQNKYIFEYLTDTIYNSIRPHLLKINYNLDLCCFKDNFIIKFSIDNNINIYYDEKFYTGSIKKKNDGKYSLNFSLLKDNITKYHYIFRSYKDALIKMIYLNISNNDLLIKYKNKIKKYNN